MLELLTGWSWSSVLLTLLLMLVVYYMVPIVFPKMPNVPGPTCWPVFGTLVSSIRKGTGRADLENIKKYGRVHRTQLRKEYLVIADVDILRQILVKDFGEFTNRMSLPLQPGISRKGLFASEDATWRRLRHQLTPAFTSGRLKRILPLVDTCCDSLLENIKPLAEKKEVFDLKKYCGAFTMDVIATSAFGLELDSQKDPNNPFLTNAKKLFEFQLTNPLILLVLFAPFTTPILERMGVTLGPSDVFSFFSSFLEKTVKERRDQNIRRDDFLQMMLDAEKLELDEEGKADLQGIEADDQKETKGLTIEEIVAQCMLFFLAAYETTSTTMSFMLYSLAENPDVQDKVYQEIQQVMANYKEPNYEALSKLTYMEQCIQETLRMYPPALRVDRRSRIDMNINGLHIPANTVVHVPIYAIHHDPDYWPQPDTFDPDRFTPEARASRNQFYHLPFGLGPRQCIGMRLALMEMKLAFVKILQKFRFTSGKVPLDLDMSFVMRSKSGMWVTPELRE